MKNSRTKNKLTRDNLNLTLQARDFGRIVCLKA